MNDDSRIGYANQVYTKQLISVLQEPIYNAIMDIYRKEANQMQNNNDILIEFQKQLKQIPAWNQNIINENVEKASAKCGFLDDLLSAVYFSNVKILSSVKIKKSNKKVHIKLPELSDFIHKAMIEVARRIYSNPQTFSVNVYGSEMNNKDAVFPMISESLNEAIIKSLPFQNILQTYFGDKLHGDESESDSEEEESDDEYPEGDEDTEGAEDTEGTEGTEQCEMPQPAQGNGFFDRPPDEEPAEVKEVPIQQTTGQTPIQRQNPVFFPDAADDEQPEPEQQTT